MYNIYFTSSNPSPSLFFFFFEIRHDFFNLFFLSNHHYLSPFSPSARDERGGERMKKRRKEREKDKRKEEKREKRKKNFMI